MMDVTTTVLLWIIFPLTFAGFYYFLNLGDCFFIAYKLTNLTMESIRI
jgi:hypothetical protein